MTFLEGYHKGREIRRGELAHRDQRKANALLLETQQEDLLASRAQREAEANQRNWLLNHPNPESISSGEFSQRGMFDQAEKARDADLQRLELAARVLNSGIKDQAGWDKALDVLRPNFGLRGIPTQYDPDFAARLNKAFQDKISKSTSNKVVNYTDESGAKITAMVDDQGNVVRQIGSTPYDLTDKGRASSEKGAPVMAARSRLESLMERYAPEEILQMGTKTIVSPYGELRSNPNYNPVVEMDLKKAHEPLPSDSSVWDIRALTGPQTVQGSAVPPSGNGVEQTVSARAVPREALYEVAEREATGPVSALKDAAGRILGNVGVEVGEQAMADRQTLKMATQDLVRALSINQKYPVGQTEMLMKELNISPAIFDSPSALITRLGEVHKALDLRLTQIERDALDERLPTDMREERATQAAAIRNFLDQLGDPPDSSSEGGVSEEDDALVKKHLGK